MQRLAILLATIASIPAVAAARLEVVTTLSDYAAIAREIGGDRVDAQAIVPGNADAHFIRPKPSYALMLRRADLFVSTGLDLELWAPVLVDKSGNRRIADGAPGSVSAAAGIELLDKPTSFSRAAGDVHIYGNPHIHTSPILAKAIAANIAAGLCQVDPGACSRYQEGLARFRAEIDRRLYGEALLGSLDSASLDPLAAQGRLVAFLDEQGLSDKLGGWLGRARSLRGRKLICYHKNWIYLTTLLGLQVVDYVEPRPGIPPNARHVAHLIRKIEAEKVKVLLAANYFEKRKPEQIAARTGIRPVIVPISVGGAAGVDTYFDLVDLWIDSLVAAWGEEEGR